MGWQELRPDPLAGNQTRTDRGRQPHCRHRIPLLYILKKSCRVYGMGVHRKAQEPQANTQGLERIPYSVTKRFWSRVAVGTPDTCWEYQGSRRSDGYGNFFALNKHRAAHRFSFYIANLYYPPVVRHKCDNPRCVNPHHLEGGTQSDNMRDAIERGRHYSAAKTHCAHGHEFSEANTYYRPDNTRECRTCRKERGRDKRNLDMP